MTLFAGSLPLKRFLFPVLILLTVHTVSGQYNWRLTKSKNGINVYTSETENSSFKAVKVECTLTGTYARLISLLTNVSGFTGWIYNNKKSQLLEKKSPYDFIYYSETSMPIPFSNRDVVIRLQLKTDSLPRFMTINGTHVNDVMPEIPGRQRITHYKASWRVTMPGPNSLHIIYFMEVDPGGSLPAWLANSFADKGPFHTFSNLAEKLKE